MKRFQKTEGKYIEKIVGQDRLAYSMSDQEDFYDVIAWAKHGGYQGSVIRFLDFENGEVDQPFQKKRNVVYGRPVFTKGFYYFLQGDYDRGQIVLYRYFPKKVLETVTTLDIKDVDLYNLELIGTDIHIISQNEIFRCYYPEVFSFPLQPQETVCLIEENQVYVEKWIEEGWDEEKDCATDQYNFYHQVIVKDLNGNSVSEEIGYLYQAADGSWWIA